MKLRPDDRVLMLSIPGNRELASVAGALTDGALVALGNTDEVDAARASFAALENVLFLDARPDAIPWRGGYFTKILTPPHQGELIRRCASELQRVLAPGGEIIAQGQDC